MSGFKLSTLRKFNQIRDAEFKCRIDADEDWNIVDRSNELAGEAGELANLCKKIRRDKLGMTSEDIPVLIDKIRDELADVIITADLLAMDLGIDLGREVNRKFNKSSEKFGLETRIPIKQKQPC